MKLYRERYFEDHIAVPDEKRPGKVKYVYAGQYVEPFVEGKSLKKWKICMAMAELANIAIFLGVSSMDVLFTYTRVIAGIGTLAIVPWLLELWSVLRFVFVRNRMKEIDRQSVERCMEAGALLRGLLILVMVVSGSVIVVRAGLLWDNMAAILGHLCMGILSFIIFKLYKKVYYHTYRDNGRGKAD